METKIEITCKENPFPGLGTGLIRIINGNENPMVIVYFPKYNIELTTMQGEEAKNFIYSKLPIEPTIEEELERVINIACEITDISRALINLRSRKKEIVFARNLVFWYAIRKLHISTIKAAKLFNMNHATAIHGEKHIEKSNKYLDYYEKHWKSAFLMKLNLNQ